MTNTASAPKKKKRLSMHQKQSLAGWAFLMPATLLIRYFEQNELCSKAECKLMQSDFARTGAAVRFYLDKYDLFEDAEVELVKRGDRAMLDVYIAKHLLGPDAENLIVSVF